MKLDTIWKKLFCWKLKEESKRSKDYGF